MAESQDQVTDAMIEDAIRPGGQVNGNPTSQAKEAKIFAQQEEPASDPPAVEPAVTDAPVEGEIHKPAPEGFDLETATPEQLRAELQARNRVMGEQAVELGDLRDKVNKGPDPEPSEAQPQMSEQQIASQLYENLMRDPSLDPDVQQKFDDGEFAAMTHGDMKRFTMNLLTVVGKTMENQTAPFRESVAQQAETAMLARIGMDQKVQDQLMAERPYIATLSGEAREQALKDAFAASGGGGLQVDAGVELAPQARVLDPSMHVERGIASGGGHGGDYVARREAARKHGGKEGEEQFIAQMLAETDLLNSQV